MRWRRRRDTATETTPCRSGEATADRDPDEGARTTITAVAHGVNVSTAGGSVSIGEVWARAVTTAHGRPGTTGTSWDRHLSGIVLQPAGQAATRLPDCENDGCQDDLLAINRALGEFARFEMPAAERTATPGGVFAGVQKTQADYLQGLTVYNDDTRTVPALQATVYADREQKLRLQAQFAGVEASSLYTISKVDPHSGGSSSPPLPSPDGSGGQIPSDPGAAALPPLPPASPLAPPSPNQPLLGIPKAATEVVAFIARSPLQALQLGVIALLLCAAPASIARRRGFRESIVRR